MYINIIVCTMLVYISVGLVVGVLWSDSSFVVHRQLLPWLSSNLVVRLLLIMESGKETWWQVPILCCSAMLHVCRAMLYTANG